MKAIANATIRFGMIALPAQVVSATESDVKFDQASPKGEVLRQIYVDPAGNEVPRDQIVKGVREADSFKAIDKAALDAIAASTKVDDLAILEVVPKDTIPLDRALGKYYVQSHNKSGNPGAFKLFVDALEAEKLAAVTKWTFRSRQKLMVLYPEDGNLVALTLTFHDDIRQADEAVEAHKSAKYFTKELDMARELLRGMVADGPTALESEVDEAISLKANLLQQALSGKPISAPVTPPAEAIDSLSESLTAMLNEQKKSKTTKKAA